MNTIIIDGKEYTLTPVETETPTPKKKWRAKEGGDYYFVNTAWEICSATRPYDSDNHDIFHNWRYLTWNYFKTEEEVKRYKEYLEAVGRVTHRVYELNEGWEVDWSDRENKYYVYFHHIDNAFYLSYINFAQYNHVLPYAKAWVYEQIMKEMEADLKVIFNYK